MKRVFALMLAATMLVGCGGPSNPPTEPVSGTVTLDGEPVEGAVITFVPDDSANQAAVARSQEDGSYELTTFASGDGAMAGTYKVQVMKMTLPEGGHNPYGEGESQTSDEIEEMSQEDELAAMEAAYSATDAKGSGKEEKAKNLLPEKYAKAASSGLSYTVEPGGGTFNIEMTK